MSVFSSSKFYGFYVEVFVSVLPSIKTCEGCGGTRYWLTVLENRLNSCKPQLLLSCVSDSCRLFFFPPHLIKCVAHFAIFVCRKSDPATLVSEKYDIIIANWVVIFHLTCSGGQWPLGFVRPLLVVLSETQGTKGAVYAAGSGAAGRQWVAPPTLRCHLCQWPKIQHLWPQCDCQPKLNTG